MRISYSDEEDYPGQFDLWQANCRRSIHGKAGQASLRELEAALVAMPSKRLIAEELDNGEDVCAIGALVRYKQITPIADADFEMEEVGMECGLPRLVAWKVVELNDVELSDHMWDSAKQAYRQRTPEERYTSVLSWVQRQLQKAQAKP